MSNLPDLKRIHFIAIGGAAMHNLAIALHLKGYLVSGSDDAIAEPSRSRLEKNGLLPKEIGWFPERIEDEQVAVILGMHARADNPELLKAQELGVRIYSYPEFLFEQTKNKKRVVIAGSHGKTTLTAMLIHVLSTLKYRFDYMVGSQIEGFENMVSLKEDSEIAIFEGDEYLSSPLDLRPKFMHYKPHIALITGIAWDHINVFPSLDSYHQQFANLITSMEEGGHLIYYQDDVVLRGLVEKHGRRLKKLAYREHSYRTEGDDWFLIGAGTETKVRVFGKHNMQNIQGAREVCCALGVSDKQFNDALSSFPGTRRRLQVLHQKDGYTAYLDFAHSPSKVKATLEAVREKHAGIPFTAILELHTFSSLNEDFIPQYRGTLEKADKAVVFFSKETLQKKRMKVLDKQFVYDSFGKEGLQVLDETTNLSDFIGKIDSRDGVLLLMSSGNFGGLDIRELVK